MRKTKLIAILFFCAAGTIAAQQSQPPDSGKPSVILENHEKPPKGSVARTITGLVKDEHDNPVRGAIVQLKDMKTSKMVDFATKDDGKFSFRDLRMDNDYELIAKHDDLSSPVKKVSIYDTRRDVVLTFKLEPPSKEEAR